MSKVKLLLPLFALVLGIIVGCGDGRPDPRDNPDFQHETLDNPAAVKMPAPVR
jgi:hypothetical protein